MLVYLMQSLWPLPCPLVLFFLFLMELLEDPNLHCSLVSALQYCTIMLLGISYTVHKLFQFMHAPTLAHFQAVKRVICPVQGSSLYGLSLQPYFSLDLLDYIDAN